MNKQSRYQPLDAIRLPHVTDLTDSEAISIFLGSEHSVSLPQDGAER